MPVALIVAAVIVVLALVTVARTVRIIPQARAGVVERLGRYSRTLNAGLNILVPFVDRMRPIVDLREQVVSFPPQPVITSDNLVVNIDTVIYYQVTDPKAATYEIANFIQAIEQLTVTTLRNVIGSIDLEKTLTSRDQINAELRGVLDEATGKWGVRVNRVELKSIDPPQSIQGAMEAQMRAERDRRAAILTAEGYKQSQILTAEGERQSAILRAEGSAQAAVLRAEGEAKAIGRVFQAIHENDPDPKLLAYQYLQTLPQIANGTANKVWVIPGEFGRALEGIGNMLGGVPSQASGASESTASRPAARSAVGSDEDDDGSPAGGAGADAALEDVHAALQSVHDEQRAIEAGVPDLGRVASPTGEPVARPLGEPLAEPLAEPPLDVPARGDAAVPPAQQQG